MRSRQTVNVKEEYSRPRKGEVKRYKKRIKIPNLSQRKKFKQNEDYGKGTRKRSKL